MSESKRRCIRKGHRMAKVTRRGYVLPEIEDMFYAVAFEVVQTRIACRRCGYSEQEWEDVSRTSLQGLTMDTWKMDKLYDEGFVSA